jgi:plastocyanin
MRTLKYANSYLISLASLLILMLAFTASLSCATNNNTTSNNTTSQENMTIALIAKDFAFNTSTINVPAGANVTVNFDNQDPGVGHNFAVYDSASKKTTIFKGELIVGPKKIVYTFNAPQEPGTYHFQCDPHARDMNGQFIVK